MLSLATGCSIGLFSILFNKKWTYSYIYTKIYNNIDRSSSVKDNILSAENVASPESFIVGACKLIGILECWSIGRLGVWRDIVSIGYPASQPGPGQGIMEYWNNGVTGSKRIDNLKSFYSFFQCSNTPVLQYSSTL